MVGEVRQSQAAQQLSNIGPQAPANKTEIAKLENAQLPSSPSIGKAGKQVSNNNLAAPSTQQGKDMQSGRQLGQAIGNSSDKEGATQALANAINNSGAKNADSPLTLRFEKISPEQQQWRKQMRQDKREAKLASIGGSADKVGKFNQNGFKDLSLGTDGIKGKAKVKETKRTMGDFDKGEVKADKAQAKASTPKALMKTYKKAHKTQARCVENESKLNGKVRAEIDRRISSGEAPKGMRKFSNQWHNYRHQVAEDMGLDKKISENKQKMSQAQSDMESAKSGLRRHSIRVEHGVMGPNFRGPGL